MDKKCSECGLANKGFCTHCEDKEFWIPVPYKNKKISRKKIAISVAMMYPSCR